MHELPTPPEAANAADATELVRVWQIDETLQTAMQTRFFKDVATWGAILAALARHVAEAQQDDEGVAIATTLARIREAFNQELDQGGDAEAGPSQQEGQP